MAKPPGKPQLKLPIDLPLGLSRMAKPKLPKTQKSQKTPKALKTPKMSKMPNPRLDLVRDDQPVVRPNCLVLPWPPSVLSPNHRAHWAKKYPVERKFLADCFWVAKSCKSALPKTVFLHLSLTFHPPSSRYRFDIDNLLARMKFGLDGIAQAWQVDDSCFNPITINFGPVVKFGRVVVSVSPGDHHDYSRSVHTVANSGHRQ